MCIRDRVTTAIGRSRAFATATAIQHDGKIVVAGQCEFGANHFCLVRYNPDGSLDNEFGIAGKVVTVEMASDHLGGIALQPDGKIVVAGTCFSYSTFSYFFCTARYHAYGALDASFGGAGVVSGRDVAGSDVAAAVTLQTDGKIVVAGSCWNTVSYTHLDVYKRQVLRRRLRLRLPLQPRLLPLRPSRCNLRSQLRVDEVARADRRRDSRSAIAQAMRRSERRAESRGGSKSLSLIHI